MFDTGEFHDPDDIKRVQKLRKAWLKYYANWEGSNFRRDAVIAKKVRRGKTPPKN